MTNKAKELLNSIEGRLSPEQLNALTGATLSDLKSSIEDVRAEYGDEAAQEWAAKLPNIASQTVREWIAKNNPTEPPDREVGTFMSMARDAEELRDERWIDF